MRGEITGERDYDFFVSSPKGGMKKDAAALAGAEDARHVSKTLMA